MPVGDVETYYEDGRWKNKVVGSARAASVHQTQSAAVGAGRQMAALREVEHIIRDVDGTIVERNTYRYAPRTPEPEREPPEHAPNGSGK
jgi:hypothetical protein